MYAQGQGVLQDFKQAEYWLFLAAEQGHAQAQEFLGAMYANGVGVQADVRHRPGSPGGFQRSRALVSYGGRTGRS
jgi:hypothetical protein